MSSKPSGLPDPEKPASWVVDLHGERTPNVAAGIFFLWEAVQIIVKVATAWNDYFIHRLERGDEAQREMLKEEIRKEIRLLINELKNEKGMRTPASSSSSAAATSATAPPPPPNDPSWGDALRDALEKVQPGSEDAPLPSPSPSPPPENEQPSPLKRSSHMRKSSIKHIAPRMGIPQDFKRGDEYELSRKRESARRRKILHTTGESDAEGLVI